MKLFTILLALLFYVNTHAQDKHTQLIDSGDVARRKMNYDRAIVFYEQAFTVAKQTRNTSSMVDDLIFIGESYISQNNMDKSIEKYLEALKLSETITTDDNPKFLALSSISYYFIRFGNLKKSEEYLNQAKEIVLKNKLPAYSQRKYYNHLGILASKQKDYKTSIEAYKKSLELTPDSMGFDKLLRLNNIAGAYHSAGKYETSYTYLQKAEDLNKSVKDAFWSMVITAKIGQYHLLQGNSKKALTYNFSALEKAETSNNRPYIKRINLQLAKTYANLKNYQKAYNHYSDFVFELEESHKQENANAIAEMEAKYEHEKKERKIKHLENQKTLKTQIHKSQIARRNLWVLIAVMTLIVTIIISILVLNNLRNKQRLRLELAEKQQEIAKQQSELEGQEKERNRLSRELHDGLGGTLASIKMRLSSKNHESIQPILKDLDAACQDVRNMSHSLNSALIEETAFFSLLKKLSNDIQERSTLNVHLEFMPVDELNQLEHQQKHQSYRIVQELTNNVIKHAQASNLTIGFIKNENDVILLIEDDGIGMNHEVNSYGIGLNNVRNRLKNIGGTMDINSTLNQGTTFSIRFPYTPEHEN